MNVSRLALNAFFLTVTLSAPAYGQGSAFFDASVNYLDWTAQTEANTKKGPIGQKADYAYLEAECGLRRSWGELYGFLDVENPANGTHENGANQSRRYAFKGCAKFNVAQVMALPVQLFVQVQDLNGADFHDQHSVLGVGTSINNDNFSHWGESFSFTNWHEIEWGRDRKYLVMADNGKLVSGYDTSQNGAVGLWWSANKRFTTGLSYRYLSNKLSSTQFQNAFVYTGRMYF